MFKTSLLALWAITLVWTPVSGEPFPPGNGSTMFNWSLDPEFDLIHSKVAGSFGTPAIPIFRVGQLVWHVGLGSIHVSRSISSTEMTDRILGPIPSISVTKLTDTNSE